MKKLVIDDRIIRRHYLYCQEQILRKLETCQIKQEFIRYFKQNLERIITGDIQQLRIIDNELKKLDCEYNEIFTDDILSIFGYKKFSEEDVQKEDIIQAQRMMNRGNELSDDELRTIKWTPYTLVYLLGYRICPYCNRQYITPVIKDDSKGKMRADLDHFLPKSKYPYFSMSIYNIIPCCMSCNRSLKRDKDVTFETPSPYEKAYDDCFKFNIDTESFTVEDIMINIYVIDEKIKPILEMFAIKELYQYHNNIAQDIYNKRKKYTDEYIYKICKLLMVNDIFVNDQNIKEMILGFSLNKEVLEKDVLGKLKYDLAKKTGFIK